MVALKKNVTAPQSQLIWSYVFRPDTTSKFADNKYKQNARYFAENADKMKEILDDLAAQACKKLGVDKLDNNLYTVPKDKDKNPIEGAIEVKFKTTSAPTVFDAKKNRITAAQVPGYKDNCMLGMGHVVFQVSPMVVSGRNYGVLYLQGVQITDLNTGGINMDDLVDIDDGFVAESPMEDEGEQDDIPDFAAK